MGTIRLCPNPRWGNLGTGWENDLVAASQVSYVNEHCAYGELPRPDRRALTEVLSTSFPIGKSGHKLWRDFPDTTAFVRRIADAPEGGPAQGILGGAIVMSYPQEQYDYLAYIAVLPEYRRQGGFCGGAYGRTTVPSCCTPSTTSCAAGSARRDCSST